MRLHIADGPRALRLEDLPRASAESGPAWDFDDHAEMRRRYPRLWTRLGWDTAFSHCHSRSSRSQRPLYCNSP
jgi:hypothetical protein